MSEDTKVIAKIEPGCAIFNKDEDIKRVALIIKGSVIASNEYMQFVISSGNIIGLNDLKNEKYIFEYLAMESCMVCYIDFNDYDDLSALASAVKEYRELCQLSCEHQTKEMINVYDVLNNISTKVNEEVKIEYEEYANLCKGYMVKPIVCNDIVNLEVLQNEGNEYGEKMYLEALFNLPVDIHKKFFESDDEILKFHLKLQTEVAYNINQECKNLMNSFNKGFELLYNTGTGNIFSMFSKLAIDVSSSKGDISEILSKMDKAVKLIKECKNVIEEDLGLEFSYDFSRINDIYNAVNSKKEKNNTDKIDNGILLDYSMDTIQSCLSQAKDTLKKILQYSGYDSEKADIFSKYITVYRGLGDKFSTEDDVRKLRRSISDMFYEIYELVYLKAYHENNHEKYIEAFLNFGLVDEKMLEPNTLVDIYNLTDAFGEANCDENKSDICVFTIRQWLDAIYKGKREPSKNEYDLDYTEYYRDLKKREKFSDEQEKAYLSDQEGKVKFEIRNMFKINNRLTNGQLTTFVPFIKEDDFIKSPKECFVSKDILKETIDAIVNIDFSAFYREYMYENLELKISKISINKEVKPDIILMPNVGKKGSMWQEIADKKRDSRGRFLIPVFSFEELKSLLIKLTGTFRWELCRTIQGTYWNDIREKSLTSEFCDYIQFYKKNKDLSEETKEKIKKQIVKCRNNTKEIFVKDYEVWVMNESLGLARLNKVSRNILSAYCAFSKMYRDKISTQPMFMEGVARFEREKIKKVKELKNRYTSIKNSNGTINEILEENLKYIEGQ